jgi:hypothetical protein
VRTSMRTYRPSAQDGPRNARFVALACYRISSASRQVVIESSNLDNERSPIIAGTVSLVFYSYGLHSLVLPSTDNQVCCGPPPVSLAWADLAFLSFPPP